MRDLTLAQLRDLIPTQPRAVFFEAERRWAETDACLLAAEDAMRMAQEALTQAQANRTALQATADEIAEIHEAADSDSDS